MSTVDDFSRLCTAQHWRLFDLLTLQCIHLHRNNLRFPVRFLRHQHAISCMQSARQIGIAVFCVEGELGFEVTGWVSDYADGSLVRDVDSRRISFSGVVYARVNTQFRVRSVGREGKRTASERLCSRIDTVGSICRRGCYRCCYCCYYLCFFF